MVVNPRSGLPALLIVTAVMAECDAVLKGLCDPVFGGGEIAVDGIGTAYQPYRITNGGFEFHLLAGGVGPVSATRSTMQAMLAHSYQMVISTGIAGGFGVMNGSLVLSTEVIAADLGIEDESGFVSLDDLGLGSTVVPTIVPWADCWHNKMESLNMASASGPVLTVSTVTGTDMTAQRLKSRVPRAIAEDMEGFGVCFSAHAMGIPSVVIRAISNPVGPREREKWEITGALDQLARSFAVFPSVLRECLMKGGATD